MREQPLSTWTRSQRVEEYRYNDVDMLTQLTVRQNGSEIENRAYSYAGSDGAGPLAPTRVGTNTTFRYDDLGRRTDRLVSGQLDQVVTWKTFDLPSRITDRLGAVTEFSYDAAGQRVLKTAASTATTYLDDLYEHRRLSSNAQEDVFFVKVGDRPVLQINYDPATGVQTETVLHDDGQGSISTASRAGSPPTRLHYAPFGRRVNAQGAPIESTPATGVTRGYTGHEHDDAEALVNMKGRIYDASLGIFLTPDPVIEHAFAGRTYGAYGYVLNNPSTFTDPTGFEVFCDGGECVDVDDNLPVWGEQDQQPAPQTTGVDFLGAGTSSETDVSPPTVGLTPGTPGTTANEPTLGEKVETAVALTAVETVCFFFGCGAANAPITGQPTERALTEDEKLIKSALGAGSMLGVGIVLRTAGAAKAVPKIASRINQSSKLAREAAAAGRSTQRSFDHLTSELARGNLNPGIGTRPIGRGLSEARARDGARVYFRQNAEGTIEILGKSTKDNQQTVIEEVLRVFGQ